MKHHLLIFLVILAVVGVDIKADDAHNQVPSGEIRSGTITPGILCGTFDQIRSGFSRVDYVTWGIYLVIILCIGLYFSKREKGTKDFFLGGKRVPWWAAGMSIFGTQLSAITFMAIPAKVYATDWTYILA